jgi:hypothetical protein
MINQGVSAMTLIADSLENHEILIIQNHLGLYVPPSLIWQDPFPWARLFKQKSGPTTWEVGRCTN